MMPLPGPDAALPVTTIVSLWREPGADQKKMKNEKFEEINGGEKKGKAEHFADYQTYKIFCLIFFHFS
ncbi:MAG: hypothetical protein RBS53_08805 [Bacteroidales bacterium]|jgi:hypothetical protein|nr:hypothetical protein [Bacteroidales bacterium]NLM92203.1 hypothetical protein [Bacteroidales bacterium]